MNKEVFKEIYLSFFFLGRAPIAPGTFGTLGGVVLAFLVTNYLESNAGEDLFPDSPYQIISSYRGTCPISNGVFRYFCTITDFLYIFRGNIVLTSFGIHF